MQDQQQQRGFGRGKGQKKGAFRPREKEEWKPVTKLGRLVKYGKITSLEQIYKFAIPIKEPQIVDHLLKDALKEEVMAVKPVQKQTRAGQRTRFQAYAVVGDQAGNIGLGWKVAKEVQGAIKGAILFAKQRIIPVRKGYWGNMIGNAHTIPCKVTGKCGSVRCRIIPAPRGTGLVAGLISKKIFQFAGIGDIYTSTRGKTKQKTNFVKAAFNALTKTYQFLTPDLWGTQQEEEHPFETYSQWFLDNDAQQKQEKLDESKKPRGRGGQDGDRRRRQFGGQNRPFNREGGNPNPRFGRDREGYQPRNREFQDRRQEEQQQQPQTQD